MKSYNHLWERFISTENYYLAVENATKHKGGAKRKYRRARYYKTHAEELQPTLIYYAEHFKSAKHTPKLIYDGIRRKQRTIIVPNMSEQVIHHMVVNVMKPIWLKTMYEHSYGSLPNRGGHKAKRTIEKWIKRNDKNMKYCLKMDIKKFFDSVPHDIVKAKLAEQIHDERFLSLFYQIIDTTDVGLPLGFYTSQWLANWYLTDLDHYIKEVLGVTYYVRYMDDMVIFGSSKRNLHKVRKAIDDYLQTKLGLRLKENWQVYLFDYVKADGTHVGRDLDFMGFRFYRNRTTLRRSIMLKATRKAKRVCRKPKKSIYDCRQMLSYLGWLDCTNTYAMYKRRIKPYVSFHQLKQRESFYAKRKARGKLLCGESQKTATPQNL